MASGADTQSVLQRGSDAAYRLDVPYVLRSRGPETVLNT
jgi:hypothetical protein